MSLGDLNPLPSIPDLSDVFKKIDEAATGGLPKDAPGDPSKAVEGTSFLSRGILIVLGLLLVGAGLFSFDKTRELVVSGAKRAGEATGWAARTAAIAA